MKMVTEKQKKHPTISQPCWFFSVLISLIQKCVPKFLIILAAKIILSKKSSRLKTILFSNFLGQRKKIVH